MGFEQGQIFVDSPTGAYFAGQFVDGRLVFELQKVKKIRGIHLTVKGFCKVHWTTQQSRRVNDRTEHYTVNHDSYEEYISLQLYLFGSKNAERTLNPGKFEYPFKFQLPTICPSSFEGKYGHVRYEIRAVMDIPYAVDKEVFMDIRVIAPLDLNTFNCKDPVNFEFDQTYCCWCCTSGVSETLVKIPVRGYCPGQVIPIEVKCKNPSNVEIDYISFRIKKEVSFRASHEPGYKDEEQTVLEMKKGPIPPHTDRNWLVEMAVPDMDVHNMEACSFIKIKYQFRVKVSPSGCHTDDDDSCEIFFGTVPLLGPSTNTLPNQMPQPYPPSISTFPQPLVNYTLTANPSHQVHSPFPQNPYPNSPYSTPNLSPVSPYPGHTAPYPGNLNNSPYPIPQNTPHLNALQNSAPYPGGNSPYPGGNSPYPGSNQPHSGGKPPYPGGNSPYPGVNPPYPGGNPPYPIGNPPPPGVNPPGGNSPYPDANPPYPVGNSPHPGSKPPYPTSNSPYPGNIPPHSMEDKPGNKGIGVPGQENSPNVPLLPHGSVPYPIGSPIAGSPYTGASAPVPGTPDSEEKKSLGADTSHSPYNPAFMEDKKEPEN